jgi:mono/diheme cytochrome c family protein
MTPPLARRRGGGFFSSSVFRMPPEDEESMKRALSRGAAAAAAAALTLALSPLAWSQAAAPASGAEEPAPKFDAAFLTDDANIKIGEAVWQAQCRHCHGNSAYPGKAPKLRPGTYTPDFVYDRVTYGFRGMPPWQGVFTLEQRKGVVAFIKSDRFSP